MGSPVYYQGMTDSFMGMAFALRVEEEAEIEAKAEEIKAYSKERAGVFDKRRDDLLAPMVLALRDKGYIFGGLTEYKDAIQFTIIDPRATLEKPIDDIAAFKAATSVLVGDDKKTAMEVTVTSFDRINYTCEQS